MNDGAPEANAVAAIDPLHPPRELLRAMGGRDPEAIVAALSGQGEPALLLAALLIEHRRKNVAVLGNFEAFVRHGQDGSLHQIIRPVTLTLRRGELFQPTKQVPYLRGTNECLAGQQFNGRKVDWRAEVAGDPSVAYTAYPGYIRMQGVAGLSVVMPPTVVVDGKSESNPHIDRRKRDDGRLGDLQRVVVAVSVIGPAPDTGNPLVVQYRLDFDPAKDIQHRLGNIASKVGDSACFLAAEEDIVADRKPGWKYMPMYAGVGYLCNLRHDDVKAAFRGFAEGLGDAVKKAVTVARRNALKSHPATAFNQHHINERGEATVAIVGWAGDLDGLLKARDFARDVAAGAAVVSEMAGNVIDVSEDYEPGKHDAGSLDEKARPTVGLSEDDEERNRLVQYIDDGLNLLSVDAANKVAWTPGMTVEQLKEVKSQVSALVRKEEGANG